MNKNLNGLLNLDSEKYSCETYNTLVSVYSHGSVIVHMYLLVLFEGIYNVYIIITFLVDGAESYAIIQ